MASGLEEFVSWLITSDRKVFLDFKYNDVDETVRNGLRNAAKAGIDFLTVHSENGSTIRAAIEGRGNYDRPKILIVTVLTSLDSDDLMDLGYRLPLDQLVLNRAQKALDAGCDGVIASGREVRAIRSLPGGDSLLIVTPGIRPSDSPLNDHKRFTTPGDAIAWGADYLVVGRPIVRAEDPRRAALDILAEMETAAVGMSTRQR